MSLFHYVAHKCIVIVFKKNEKDNYNDKTTGGYQYFISK